MRRDPLWRAMWTAGLGLAVMVFTGLLLNLIPAGLTRLTWIISLAAMAVVAALVVVWRTRRLTGSPSRPHPPVYADSRRWSSLHKMLRRRGALRCRGVLRRRGALRCWLGMRAFPGYVAGARFPSRAVVGYVAGAVAIVGAAIGLAVASVGWQHSPGFAQLWLVPARSGTASLPAAGGHVALGVRSRYPGAETFRLVLLRGTQPMGTWDFRLGAGQSWQRDVSAPVGQRLTARLTTVGRPSGTQSVAVASS